MPGPSTRLRQDVSPTILLICSILLLLVFAESGSVVQQVGAFIPSAAPLRNADVPTRPTSVFPHQHYGHAAAASSLSSGTNASRRNRISAPYSSRSRSRSTILPAVATVQLITTITATYEGAISLAQATAQAYSTSLIEHPLPTKSITSGGLCGISDVVAQRRDPVRGAYNIQRTLRFASKGCLGGILWTCWYDWIDGFLRYSDDAAYTSSSPTSLYALTGALVSRNNADAYASVLVVVRAHLGAVTTLLSILLEQFIWCPLVYGTFEIPVSTLLNGGAWGGIRKEVDAKLNGLLVSNAKVWTLANLVIYNAPLEWRLFIGNCIDIFWQSIVSDVSADCGKVGDDVCEIPDDDDENNPDPSFYAKKSRI